MGAALVESSDTRRQMNLYFSTLWKALPVFTAQGLFFSLLLSWQQRALRAGALWSLGTAEGTLGLELCPLERALWLGSMPHISTNQHSQYIPQHSQCTGMHPAPSLLPTAQGNALLLQHHKPQHRAEHKAIDHLLGR